MMSQYIIRWYIEIYSWKFHENLLKVVAFNDLMKFEIWFQNIDDVIIY